MTPELIAAIIACLGALTAFIKSRIDVADIKNQRNETAILRDREIQELRDKVQKCEWENKYLKDEQGFLSSKLDDQAKQTSLLTTELAKMSVKIDNVLNAIEKLTKED